MKQSTHHALHVVSPLSTLAENNNNSNDVKLGLGDTEMRSHLTWETSRMTSQGRQHLNKVPQGLRGSDAGVEEGGGGREEDNCRRGEGVPKGNDVKGPGEGEQVIHFN